MELGQGSQPTEGETGNDCALATIPSMRPRGGSALSQGPRIYWGKNREATACWGSWNRAPQIMQKSPFPRHLLGTTTFFMFPGDPDCGSDASVSQRKELGITPAAEGQEWDLNLGPLAAESVYFLGHKRPKYTLVSTGMRTHAVREGDS